MSVPVLEELRGGEEVALEKLVLDRIMALWHINAHLVVVLHLSGVL